MMCFRNVFLCRSLLVFLLFLSASCSMQLSQHQTLLSDPFVETPRYIPLLRPGEITLSWSADPSADEFFLYRSSTSGGAYTQVYAGTGTSFTDRGLVNTNIYYYKLAKRKGEKMFPQSAAVATVFSNRAGDVYEPNNTIDEATPLRNSMFASIFSYRNTAGTIVEDTDWYYITLQPRRRAVVSAALDNLAGAPLLNDEVIIHLSNSAVPQLMSRLGDIVYLENRSFTPIRVYLSVTINRPVFYAVPGFLGKMGEYTLLLQREEPIP